METNNKGHLAFLKTEMRCAEKDFIFLKPSVEGGRYDAVIDDGKKTLSSTNQILYS